MKSCVLEKLKMDHSNRNYLPKRGKKTLLLTISTLFSIVQWQTEAMHCMLEKLKIDLSNRIHFPSNRVI